MPDSLIRKTTVAGDGADRVVEMAICDQPDLEQSKMKIILSVPVAVGGYPKLIEFQGAALRIALNALDAEIEWIERVSGREF